MSLKRIDLLMGLIGLILVVASSYQLISSHRQQGESGIALLEMIDQTVKTRQGTDLFWTTPSQGSAIQDNQLVFTAQKSAARVSFKDGNVIDINENSLVRIKSSNLNLVKGELTTKLAGNDLEIQVGDQTLKLRSDQAQVAIQKAGDKTLIGVVSGEVNVIDQEQNSVNASPNNIVEVGEGKLEVKERMDITPLPHVSQRFYTAGDSYLVRFGDYPGQIFITNDENFRKARSFRVGERLSPGSYYWRVISDTHESLIFNFEIIKDSPPQVYRPEDGTILKFNLPASLNLQWEVTDLETEIEVVLDEAPIVEKIFKGSLLQLMLEKEGLYKWRVRKKYLDHKDSVWTSWQEFRVIDLKKDLPQNLLPEEYEVQTYDLESEKVEYSWNYPGEVVISIRDVQGNAETFRAKDKFSWNISREGEFFVKVKAADNPLDVWTSESRVFVKDLSQEKNLEVYTVELSRPDQDVNFSWEGKKGEYLFELSRSQDFKNIILSRKVSNSDIKVSIPEIGSYYWRSRVLANGQWKSSAPKRIIIRPTPAPQRPKSLPELKLPLKLKKKTSSFSFIPEAFAVEGAFVAIELPKHEEAKFFRLEVYRDENLEKLVFKKTSKRNKITWPGAQGGKYYYRYSIIDYWDRESEFSDASLLEITSDHLRPERPKELKLEVKDNAVTVFWDQVKLAAFYRVEIARNKDFKNAQIINTPNSSHQFNVESGHYYLRVKSFNDFGESSYQEKSFKITIRDQVVKEADKNQLFFLYRPSMDQMEFSDGQSGKVKGEVIGAGEVRYERVDQYLSIFKADLLLGKVFEGESYQQYSVEGSLDYLFRNDDWKISAGPLLKWWSLPGFSIENKVTAKSESHFTAGGHARLARGSLNQEFVFDQYVYISGVSGFLSELSYRKNLNRFNLFTGVGFENIEFQEQKKNSVILKIGLGISF